MDLAKTDLLSLIEKQDKIDEVQAKVWFNEIGQGLTYLHSKNYAHRDLKLENILINSKNVALISDFGFVKETSDKALSITYCGSASYSAPEILINTPYDPFAADVWSFGVCIFAALAGHMPFHGHKDDGNEHLKKEQKSAESKVSGAHVSVGAKDLLHMMLRYREKERIKMKDTLNHEWLRVQLLPVNAKRS